MVFLVVLHVSDPYSRTNFTYELEILSSVWVAIGLAYVFKLEEGYSCLTKSCFDTCISSTMIVHNATQVCEGFNFLQSTSSKDDWADIPFMLPVPCCSSTVVIIILVPEVR